MKKRINWIDNMRGIGMFLVICGHVFKPAGLNEIVTWIYSFHMPLFFMISGCVWYLQSQQPENMQPSCFFKKRMTQIVIPYISLNLIALLFWILNYKILSTSASSVTSLIKGMFIGIDMPANPMWFVMVLLWISILFFLLQKITRNTLPDLILAVITIFIIGYCVSLYMGKAEVPFHWNLIYTGLLFYGIGYCFMAQITRIDIFASRLQWEKYPAAAAIITLGTIAGMLNDKVSLYSNKLGCLPLFLLSSIGISFGCFLLIENLPNIPVISYIGKNTIVYLALHIPILRTFQKINTTTQQLVVEHPLLLSIFIYLILIPVCAFLNKYVPPAVGKTKIHVQSFPTNPDIAALNWGLLSKHRAKLMGFAIIWVILYHGTATDMVFPSVIDWLNVLLKRGNNGVDIFLLLSGIGLYFSFRNNSDIKNFYKKRVLRVLIPYLLMSSPFWILQDIIMKKDLLQFIKDITLYSFWTEGIIRTWYIALILPLYLIFPYIYRFVFRTEKEAAIRGWTLIILVMCINYLISYLFPSWYDRTEIALTRIPVFLLGVLLGNCVKEQKAFTFRDALALVILFSTKLFFNMYQVSGVIIRYWYAVLALSVCVLLCMIFEMTKNLTCTKKINAVLQSAGNRSLELYIVHIWIRRLFIMWNFDYILFGHNFNKYGILNYALIILITIALSSVFIFIEEKFLFKNINRHNS